jgi:hypothetical protein
MNLYGIWNGMMKMLGLWSCWTLKDIFVLELKLYWCSCFDFIMRLMNMHEYGSSEWECGCDMIVVIILVLMT